MQRSPVHQRRRRMTIVFGLNSTTCSHAHAIKAGRLTSTKSVLWSAYSVKVQVVKRDSRDGEEHCAW